MLCVSISAFSKIIHLFLSFLEMLISTALLSIQHENLIITSFNQCPLKLADLKCCLLSLLGAGSVSPRYLKINPSTNSLLPLQWMYLVQFKIKHFFTLQFLHNGFIFVQELPTRRDLFVFSFYSRISRILDSVRAAAWKSHFYPFKYWLVPCSPKTSFRQTAYTDNNLPKDQNISISMPLQLNSPSGESLPAAWVLFIPVLMCCELYFLPAEAAINFKSWPSWCYSGETIIVLTETHRGFFILLQCLTINDLQFLPCDPTLSSTSGMCCRAWGLGK